MSIDTTTPPTAGSVYPPAIEDLLPRARSLAETLGAVPSRNRLMGEFKIGAPKANALREALTAEAPATDAETAPRPPQLHLVGADGQARTATPYLVDTGTVERIVTDAARQRGANAEGAPGAASLASGDGHPGTPTDDDTGEMPAPATDSAPAIRRAPRAWPVLLLALPAFVAVWSGWVGLGGMTGFGIVHPLPGIADGFSINSAITLPIGVEAYAAFALHAWLSANAPVRARRFAGWSALASLAIGAAGQVAYHLMTASHVMSAPWPITTAVACLPVAVLGMGAALAHLLRDE